MNPNRSGGNKNRKTAPVHIPLDVKPELERQAKIHKVSQGIILATLIEMNGKYALLKPGWEKRLEFAEIEANRYAFLEEACDAMAWVDGKFKCVWGGELKTPDIKVLSHDEEGARNVCKSCNKTRMLKMVVKDKDLEIEVLKEQLNRKIRIKIPTCKRGGRLIENGTELYCPIQGISRKPEYCEKICSSWFDWVWLDVNDFECDLKSMM